MKRLAAEYGSQGLVILAFPCDEFGGQELGTDPEIAAFAAKAGFDGTLLAKRPVVNGPGAGPCYSYLHTKAGMGDVGWNFDGKFLVSRTGEITFPTDPESDIAALL